MGQRTLEGDAHEQIWPNSGVEQTKIHSSSKECPCSDDYKYGSGKACRVVSHCAAKPAAKGCGVSDMSNHFGHSIGFVSLRETLLKLKEVGAYMERMDSTVSAVDGLLSSLSSQA